VDELAADASVVAKWFKTELRNAGYRSSRPTSRCSPSPAVSPAPCPATA